ncbi:MAG: hypothetical protein D6762_03605, partial [Candidatus Neomarinimicrobiota bacterium]
MVKKILPLLFLLPLLFTSCGKKAIEAETGAQIPLVADLPNPGESYDITWELTAQPDGSLLQLEPFINPDHPESLTFIPDAPGDYTVQVTVKQYGDEVGVQSWDYNVSGEVIDIQQMIPV